MDTVTPVTTVTQPAWIPKVAPSVESLDARARHMDWEIAQLWCNFVLLRVGQLPDDLVVTKTEMRPEAPPGRLVANDQTPRPTWTLSNRACHRSELVGKNRKVRIKQFLYDWAPPAFDCPSLWLSGSVRPFIAQDEIGWLGVDFRGLQGAAIRLHGTTVEISVLEGALADDEFGQICSGLSPADSAVLRFIEDTPLADLCYQIRHREPPIEVPVGFWAHQRKASDRCEVFHASQAPGSLPARGLVPQAPAGYRLDTVFYFGDGANTKEVDYAYVHSSHKNLYLRLLVSPFDQAEGIRFPPVPDRQPCTTEHFSMDGATIFYAFVDERYGPHEAVWQREGFNWMLLAKPARHTDRQWFGALLCDFLK
jgi:hypothetical protein